MTRFQCQTVNLKNDSFYCTTDKLSRFTHGAFASMWALPRIEISRNFLPLQTVDLVHLCRELVHKSGQSLRVCVSHFLPQTPHEPTDMSRSGIPINSLRKDGPESFNAPKVIPFWSEKQRIGIFISPERWGMSRKVLFHELLVCICGMGLCKILLKDHIAVFRKHFSLVNRQTLRFLSLQNVVQDHFLQDLLLVDATIHTSLKMNQRSEGSCTHAQPNHALAWELVSLD